MYTMMSLELVISFSCCATGSIDHHHPHRLVCKFAAMNPFLGPLYNQRICRYIKIQPLGGRSAYRSVLSSAHIQKYASVLVRPLCRSPRYEILFALWMWWVVHNQLFIRSNQLLSFQLGHGFGKACLLEGKFLGTAPDVIRICPRCKTKRPARDDGHRVFIDIAGADSMGLKWTVLDDVVNELRIMTVEWVPQAALGALGMVNEAMEKADSAGDIVSSPHPDPQKLV